MVKVSELPDWVKNHKKKNIEIRKKGSNYYAYKITSKYDPEKKRSQKITDEYLGKVTRDGIVPPKHKRKKKPEAVLETGNILLGKHFLSDLIPGLKETFSDSWQTLVASAVLKLCYKTPIKNMKALHDTSWSHKLWGEATLSPNTMTKRLKEWGVDHGARTRFFRTMSEKGDQMAIDLTQIFSDSQNIDWLEPGYNPLEENAEQLNLLLIYNMTTHAPSFLKLLPGSLRDVSTVGNAIKESGLDNVLLVGDKGFFSGENIKKLEKQHVDFLIALRRNLKILEYGSEEDYEDYLSWRDRYIWHRNYRVKGQHLFSLNLSKYEDYLRGGSFYPDLRKRFKEEGYALDRDAQIIGKKDDPWLIQSGAKEYRLKKSSGEIRVQTVRWVHHFLDEKLRVKEKKTFLEKVDKGEKEQEGLSEVKDEFGTLALITSSKKDSEQVYKIYKQRQEIEKAFDILKNNLEADKSHMQDRDSINGYFFMLFIALYGYSQILDHLRKRDLLGKYSVDDVLMYLSKFYRIVVDGEEIDSEVPKKTRELVEELKVEDLKKPIT